MTNIFCNDIYFSKHCTFKNVRSASSYYIHVSFIFLIHMVFVPRKF